MDNKNNIDTELIAPLENFLNLTNGGLNLHDIPGTRAMMAQSAAATKAVMPVVEGVIVDDRKVPGPEGAEEVSVRVYQPENRAEALPALLWIHGGGYVLGSVEGDDVMARNWAKDLNCVVVSVEYRLAPENPFPAPLDDCYAALKWLASENDLDVDKSRIVIGGASAGGGLAAGLALLARDRGEVSVAYQLLIYPMIDDANLTQASDEVADTFVWSRESNLLGWRCYLGAEPGGDGISQYAAPFRASELAQLPPAFISVGDQDLFLSENIDYAHRLLKAGIATELHVYPGGYHAFNGFAPSTDISRRFNTDRDAALKRALQG